MARAAVSDREAAVSDREAAVSDREKALGAALAQIEKQFGKGAVMRLGAEGPVAAVPVLSTGSLALDLALGVGGVPRGRVVEIFGPEGSGKTTLALHLVAEAQKAGGVAAYIDAEHALDPAYARRLGVELGSLLISQPDSGEQALEIVETLVRSTAVDLVVIDSVAALVPRAELEGEMGDSLPGLQARLMSQALRKLTATIHRTMATVVFLNQIRMKIGVLYGNPETTTGGNALKFYASVRLDIRRVGALKEGAEVVGNRTRVKVVKNKVSPPFKEVEFDLLYGQGISRLGDLIDLGVEVGALEKAGAWFSVGEARLGQGREAVKAYLAEHPALATQLEHAILASIGVQRGGPTLEPVASEEAAAAEEPSEEAPAGRGPAANGRMRARG
jgi:recombination protein RecA